VRVTQPRDHTDNREGGHQVWIDDEAWPWRNAVRGGALITARKSTWPRHWFCQVGARTSSMWHCGASWPISWARTATSLWFCPRRHSPHRSRCLFRAPVAVGYEPMEKDGGGQAPTYTRVRQGIATTSTTAGRRKSEVYGGVRCNNPDAMKGVWLIVGPIRQRCSGWKARWRTGIEETTDNAGPWDNGSQACGAGHWPGGSTCQCSDLVGWRWW
jgi:hypothetical protein